MSDRTNRPKPDVPPLGFFGKAMIGVIVAPFVLCFIGLAWSIVSPSSAEDEKEGTPEAAEFMCEDFAKDKLKSPSTAEFDLIAVGSDPKWEVTGTVDSENSFGAMVRSSVVCELTHETGSDMWRATTVFVQ